MINPEEIRLAVLRGEIPSDWRVIYGSPLQAFNAVLRKCISPWLVGTIIAIIAYILTRSYYPWEGSDRLLSLLYLGCWPLGCLIGACIQANIARNSLLIFFPEGCLQCSNVNGKEQNERIWECLWYASIDDIQINTSFRRGTFLEIKWLNGHKIWYANPCYGHKIKTLQDILVAYTIYTTLHLHPIDKTQTKTVSSQLV